MARLQLINMVDDIIISVHTLRPILKSTGLSRRKNESNPLEVASFPFNQLVELQKASWIQAAPL